MKQAPVRIPWLAFCLVVAAGVVISTSRLAAVAPARAALCAAYYHNGQHGPELTLFPIDGPSRDLPLPPEMPIGLDMNPFSPDGKALFVPHVTLGPRDRPPEPVYGLAKIEFKPPSDTEVPGSQGLHLPYIWRLTLSLPPGKLFVSGAGGGECGTFEIDMSEGTRRALVQGTYPHCFGDNGPVSPDGKHVLRYDRKRWQLVIANIETGSELVARGLGRDFIRGGDGLDAREMNATWSPDGRWVGLVLQGGKIVLIDAADPSHRKDLGRSPRHSQTGPIIWSPDSSKILLYKPQLLCSAHGEVESLETLDVATGARKSIPSSRCAVDVGWVGWMDLTAVE